MRILLGKAQLEIQPTRWLDPRLGSRIEQATAVLRALFCVHPCILAITLGYSFPAITVDVAIPEDGSLDLTTLHRDLSERVRLALAA